MKLRKVIFQKSKLIRLQLIKTKTYKKSQTIIDENFRYSELYLKKALQIIYKYHYYNKKIFFIGLPLKVQQNYTKLFFQIPHLFIPKSIWLDGIITNKVSVLKYLHHKLNLKDEIDNANLKFLLKIKQKPDLIVLFDKEIESVAFEEAVKLKIPVIAITRNIKPDKNVLYSMYNEFHYLDTKLSNLYIYLLNSILKKRQNK